MRCVRFLAITLLACSFTTPAAAQFGGLKNKLKKGEDRGDQSRAAPAPVDPAAQGGTVVLTPDVVNQLMTGLKAGKAERKAAAKEDTPYGRYRKAQLAYAEAQPKCEAGKQAFIQKAGENPKLLDKVNALNQKMIAAQSKQDYKTMEIYQDSSMLLQGGSSCIVKKPDQPKDYYEAQRAVDIRADEAAVKASGLSAGEFAMAQERAMMIIGGGGPSDVSQSEKEAVMAKKPELQQLLRTSDEPLVQAAPAKPAPTPPPAAAAAPAPDPEATAVASDMNACMMKNMQANQDKLQALGKRAEAAQKAGDQAKLMAIADTLQQIQMAGCMAR
jgi:hypothetical protein